MVPRSGTKITTRTERPCGGFATRRTFPSGAVTGPFFAIARSTIFVRRFFDRFGDNIEHPEGEPFGRFVNPAHEPLVVEVGVVIDALSRVALCAHDRNDRRELRGSSFSFPFHGKFSLKAFVIPENRSYGESPPLAFIS